MLSSSVAFPSAAGHLSRPARGYSLRPWVEIADRTGPLDCLAGRNVLVLLDLENLHYSARDLGYAVDLPGLAKCLLRASRRCMLHAFVSAETADTDTVSRQYGAVGWELHVNPIEEVRTCRGVERLANADNLLLFSAGLLLSRSRADTIVVGSGDGHLVVSLARGIAELPRRRQLATLSLAGSTSARLEAGRNRLITANVELGLDMLHLLTSGASCLAH